MNFNAPARLLIWVVEPNRTTVLERDELAVAPGPHSQRLSAELHSLGHTPRLWWDELAGLSIVGNSVPAFNATESLWSLSVKPSKAAQVRVAVSTRAMSVMGCTVPARSFLLSLHASTSRPTGSPSFPFAASPALSFAYPPSAPLNTVQRPAFVSGSCNPQLGAVVYPNASAAFAVLRTMTGFRTTEAVAVPKCAAASTRLLSAHVAGSRFLFLTDAGTCVADANLVSATASQYAPIGSRTPCPCRLVLRTAPHDPLLGPTGGPSELNDLVVGWENGGSCPAGCHTTGAAGGIEPVLWLSTNGGLSFAGVAFPSTYSTFVIADAAPLISVPRALVLGTLAGTPHALMYDYRAKQWITGQAWSAALGTLPSGHLDCPTQLHASLSGSNEVLASGAQLFYSPNGGLNFHTLALPSTECVAQVTTSANGSLAVRTRDNRLFYGQLGVNAVIEIAAGSLPGYAASELAFDSTNTLWALTAPTGGAATATPTVTRQSIDVSTALEALPVCPLLSFTQTLPARAYLDMQETFNFSAEARPQDRTVADSICISFADQALLRLETTEASTGVYSGMIRTTRRTLEARISTQSSAYATYNERVAKTKGATDIRVGACSATLACQPAQSVGRVRIGCPPHRHIRIQHTTTPKSCPEFHPGGLRATYVLSPTIYHPEGKGVPTTTARTVTYDYARLGCPYRVYYGTAGYRPKVLLYSGDTLIRELGSNFVTYEIYGRFDYTYNTTDQQAGCLLRSQDWAEVSGVLSINASRWGPENYVSCFRNDTGRQALDTAHVYQLLNNSGAHNALKFTSIAKNGVFVFRAKVVDPDCSFCTLTADFALDMYGAPIDSAIAWSIVGGTLFLFAVLLVVSYFWYRRSKLSMDFVKND